MTTPKQDILGDILNDPQTGRIRGIEALNDLIHACAEPEKMDPPLPPEEPERAKKAAPRRRSAKGRRRPKKKTTHYLAREVFDGLGDAKENIRELLPKGVKSKATKSRIVESAVRVILEDFERKGEESYLVRELSKKK